MRPVFICLLCLINLSALVAQNWLPISLNDRLSFRHSDSSLISQELQVVGDKVLPNGDVLWQLNRTATRCDTCSSIAFLRDQGQILQQRMILRNDGEIHLVGSRSWLLKPNAPLGTSWLFDTLNNLSALVSNVSLGVVLGQSDSLKILTLSNGKEILLSRNFGLVSWPDLEESGAFELVGIQTRALGQWTPTWQDFYNFSVGDVFQHAGSYTQDPGTPNTAYTYSKTIILEKWTVNDTLFYKSDHRNKVHFFGPFSIHVHDTIIQKFHPSLSTPWSESWPNQLWYMPALQSSQSSDSVFVICRLLFDARFGLSKIAGGSQEPPWSFPQCNIMYPDPDGQSDLMLCDYCVEFTDQLSVGLGITDHHFGCFEYFEDDELIGYIKNGDTTGVVYPEDFYTAVKEPSLQLGITVSPNPTHSKWQVTFETLSESAHAVLSDVHGLVLRQFTLQQGLSNWEIPGENLPGGVYFLKFGNKERQGIGRLIKF